MKCPVCEHETGESLLKCSECANVFDRETMEEYEHLNYLLAWLRDQTESLEPTVSLQLLAEAQRRKKRLVELLHIEEIVPSAEPVKAVPLSTLTEYARELELLRATRKRFAEWRIKKVLSNDTCLSVFDHLRAESSRIEQKMGDSKVAVVPPSELDTLNFISAQLPSWLAKHVVSKQEIGEIRKCVDERKAALLATETEAVPATGPVERATVEPAPGIPAKPEPVATTTKVKARPKPPPKPREPIIDWPKMRQKARDAAASGMLLNVLLYLGAFMIIISAAILVIRFWESFPPALQLAVIAAAPAIFYLLGWLGRAKLKLPQAGRVLTYIGALLVAVDFAAIYQFGGLSGQIDSALYWFAASLVCTTIYALTAWRLPTEFAGYITSIGLVSALAALTAWIGLPLQWQVASVALSALVVLALAYRLQQASGHWGDLATAGRRLPHILLPLAQIAVLFAPGRLSWAQMMTFALASTGYATLGWRFARQPRWQATLTHASVWSSVGAVLFAILAIQLPARWYAATAALVAPIYIVAGKKFGDRLSDDFRRKSLCLAAFYGAGFGLLALAILASLGMLLGELFGPNENLWAAVITLVVASVVLSGSSALFQSAWFLLAGSGLFILPFSIVLAYWLTSAELRQWAPWLMTAWSGLAILYMSTERFLSLGVRYGMALQFWAQALAPSAVLGLFINYLFTAEEWIPGPTLFALASVMLIYAISIWIHDDAGHPALSGLVAWLPEPFRSSIFLWPLGLLLPVWAAIAWIGAGMQLNWLGTVLAILALVYIGLGQLIFSRRPSYRLPLHAYSYGLPAIGIGLAVGDTWALLVTLILSVAVLAAQAYIYRRVLEVAAAAVLFIWPFQLALTISPITPHAYTLAYALLAGLVYIPIGQALRPRGFRMPWKIEPDRWPRPREIPHAMALYSLGYALAACALAASILGRFDVFAVNVSWIGVAVPLVVCSILAFGLYRFRERPFAWAAILVLTIAFWQTLALLQVPEIYAAAAWVGLAVAYMLAERALARWMGTSWMAALGKPLWAGAIVLCALGLLLTAGDTYDALSGKDLGHFGPIILAQSLAVGLAILAAWLYRSRWPLYFEPWLIFFPVTLFFVGYGSRVFGQPLATEQYSFVWIGLALLHLASAAILDSRTVRYAHGLFAGGYAVAVLALGWSVPDRYTNTIVLGLVILIATCSQVLVHLRRHRTYDDLLGLVRLQPDTVSWQAARGLFLFIAVYGFPVWLAQLLTYHQVAIAWRGLAFAVVAPLYIALGLLFGRLRTVYTWPFYSAGYALTAIGAMIAIDDQRLFIAILCLNAAVYAASSYIFRQPFWLYLSNTLLPIIALLVLDYNEQLTPPLVAATYMGLAYAYVLVGWLIDRRIGEDDGISSYSLPFFAVGYLMSAISLAVGSRERALAISVFSSAVLLYSLSARLFRETLFVYPAAWLAAVPYYLLMTLTPIAEAWYGVGLLPLVAAYIAIGRFVFHGVKLDAMSWPAILASLVRPAMPFYLLAYAFTIWAVTASFGDAAPLTASLVLVSAVYFGSAALFRSFVWLYPGLLTAHMAILAYISIDPGGGAVQYLSIPYMILTWLLVLFGLGFNRRFQVVPKVKFASRSFKIGRWQVIIGGWPSIGYLLTPSWSQPFFIFVVLDVIVWQLVALGGYETTVLLACSNMLLTGILATAWRDWALSYGALGFAVLAAGASFAWADLTMSSALALMGGVALVLYALARLVELARIRYPRLLMWSRPLERVAVLLSIAAVIGTVPSVVDNGQATAAALGFAGTLYLVIAYRARHQQLGYLAVAMLELAWILILIGREIAQPQLYAVPIGLYFTGIGVMERRRGNVRYANILEGFGLAVILLTTFIQSLQPSGGLLYFLLLLVESFVVTAWGLIRNVKVPFFSGLAAIILNIVGQLVFVATVNDLWRWIIILGTGVLVISLGILIERKREYIATQIGEWQAELRTWS
ncbi:MAG: hypothetical protein JSW55_16945 [Chloroflexota bacterium]|nr:MAG: hypothetical protein JSW55_16945 [Chloroflexota bacterium]